jgi:hypothetical protein
MEYATDRRIMAVWTVAFTREEGKARIHGYSRTCAHGYENEKALPRCNMDEGSGRKVLRLYLQPNKPFRHWANPTDKDTECLEVVNPEYIFSYGDCPEPKE